MAASGDVRRMATTFDVEDLVTRAWRGDIRVPHFQRAFRWKWDDAKKLFDSIVMNYPIGSLLLWSRSAPADRIQLGALHIDAPASSSALWVVDGQQRITSMANVLHPDAGYDPRFALAYNLRNEQFVKPRSTDDASIVPLPVLFDNQRLLAWFFEHPEIKEHLDSASAITKKIRDYSVPAYQVEHEDERVLEDIFDRMNNYGKRLTKAEVFSALNAGDEGSMADRLTFPRIASHINESRHFGELDEGTILQAILSRRNPDIQRDIRKEFAPADDEGRDTAYEAGQEALIHAVSFLQDEATVPHLSLLPYRYLLIVLTRFFALYPQPDEQNRKLLRRWFWRAAALGPGAFPGGTTGAARILGQCINHEGESRSVSRLLDAVGDEPDVSPTPNIRAFRTNAAATRLLLCSWWAAGPRDPETGELFDVADLAEALTGQSTASAAIHSLISQRVLPEEMRSSAGNKILLPVLHSDPSEILELLTTNRRDLPIQTWESVLQSHFFEKTPPFSISGLKSTSLVHDREELMYKQVLQFLQLQCEWGFEDTPPLNELIIDDDTDTNGLAADGD